MADEGVCWLWGGEMLSEHDLTEFLMDRMTV